MFIRRSLALALHASAGLAMLAPATAETYKMTTPIAPGVASPDELETSIGRLTLNDGVPTPETTQKDLRQSRPVARPSGLSAGDSHRQPDGHAQRPARLRPGQHHRRDLGNLVDSKTVELTANDNVVYSFIWLDTSKGPLVLEIPPEVLGLIDDMWYRWVADVGITGEDRGKGGKYLILPPDYKGEVPDGYFVLRPTTYGNWMPFRSFLDANGSPKPGVDLVKKSLKIYPLRRRGQGHGDEVRQPLRACHRISWPLPTTHSGSS